MSTYKPTKTDAFGHWLAGFIDGEGCFCITHNPRGAWEVKFDLSVRDDDADIIDEIRQYLGGIGRIHRLSERTHSRPQIVWRVARHQDCLVLIDFLDQHSLRAKKVRDYSIWREAVMAKDRQDFSAIADLGLRIKSGRTYKPTTSRR